MNSTWLLLCYGVRVYLNNIYITSFLTDGTDNYQNLRKKYIDISKII